MVAGTPLKAWLLEDTESGGAADGSARAQRSLRKRLYPERWNIEVDPEGVLEVVSCLIGIE
jgi:hypothetical protein